MILFNTRMQYGELLIRSLRCCLMQREMLLGCLPRKTVDKRIRGHARLGAVDMRLRRHVQLPRIRGSFRDLHLPEHGGYQVSHSFGTGFNALATRVLLFGSVNVLLSFNAQYPPIPRVLSRLRSTSFLNHEILRPHPDRFEADTTYATSSFTSERKGREKDKKGQKKMCFRCSGSTLWHLAIWTIVWKIY